MQSINSNISKALSLSPLSATDQPGLFELMRRIYPSAYGHYWKDDCSWYLESQYGTTNFTKELETHGGEYYFVWHDAAEARFGASPPKIIGIFKIISNCTYPPIPNKSALKIHRIYLDPAIQGKGIGKQLMMHAEQYASATNHALIWLDAMDTHTQAQAFYTGLGYVRTALQSLDFELLHDEHRPMWYMHKLLE